MKSLSWALCKNNVSPWILKVVSHFFLVVILEWNYLIALVFKMALIITFSSSSIEQLILRILFNILRKYSMRCRFKILYFLWWMSCKTIASVVSSWPSTGNSNKLTGLFCISSTGLSSSSSRLKYGEVRCVMVRYGRDLIMSPSLMRETFSILQKRVCKIMQMFSSCSRCKTT